MSRYRIWESVLDQREAVHSYEDLEIHHPRKNQKGLRTGHSNDFEPRREHRKVDGEFEEVRTLSDGRVLVKKDFILGHDGHGPVYVPAPADGYVHYLHDETSAVRIYDRPFGEGRAKLLAQSLHMDPRSFRLKEGEKIRYGQAMGVMSDKGTPGVIHAHVEAEPEQFRRYIGDIDAGVIKPDHQFAPHPAKHRGESAKGNSENQALEVGSKGSRVRELQQSLQRLGYTGRDGQPLKADGQFGANTEFAVRAFQRAHHLQVDGRAGHGQTLPAIDAASKQLLTDPAHPRHALYAQALDKVHAEEARRHVAHGPHSERLAGAMAVAAMHANLTRIDRVELNAAGTLARAVQVSPVRDEPALNRTTTAVDTHAALRQPLQVSSQQAREVLPLVPAPAMAMTVVKRVAP